MSETVLHPNSEQATFRATDFDAMFRVEYPVIASAITWMLNDDELAAEITQEAFIRLYMKWKHGKTFDSPGAWARRVAVRLAIKLKIRRRRESLQAPPEGGTHPTESISTMLDVRNAIAQLPRAQKAAVLLHYFYDLPVAEVANEMGCKEATVKVHLHRGREQLRGVLESQGYSR